MATKFPPRLQAKLTVWYPPDKESVLRHTRSPVSLHTPRLLTRLAPHSRSFGSSRIQSSCFARAAFGRTYLLTQNSKVHAPRARRSTRPLHCAGCPRGSSQWTWASDKILLSLLPRATSAAGDDEKG